MFQAKPWVLDRIEQSFWVFIKNPLALVAPLALFQIIMIALLPQIGISMILWGNFIETSSISSVLYITMSLAIIYAMLYVILIIPITIWVMKWAADLINGKDIIMQDMIRYGFYKISDAFKVYWYMFSYAYLVPALCFIVAGIITLYGLYFDNVVISALWWGLMTLSIFYALIQWVYRGLESTFGVGWAIFEENFSKQQFQLSIGLTRGKWWRILWNFFLIAIISSFLLTPITWLIWSIAFIWTISSGIDIESFLQPSNENIEKNLKNFIGNIWGFNLSTFLMTSISQILWSIVSAFIILFSLIFYVRLKQEVGIKNTPIRESFVNNEL
jgi:hypothetical protein